MGFWWWLRWPLLVAFGLLAVSLNSTVPRVMCAVMAVAQCLYIADGIVQRRSQEYIEVDLGHCECGDTIPHRRRPRRCGRPDPAPEPIRGLSVGPRADKHP